MTAKYTMRNEESTGAMHAGRNLVEDRLLTIQEVAHFTGLSVGTMYHLVSQKRIPVVRLSKRCIRFRKSDLSAWIEALSEGTR